MIRVSIAGASLATGHVFLDREVDEKALWRIYRSAYAAEPFVRIVKERAGVHRYPDPNLLAGSNYCDVGFERDPLARRVVVLSAIDNLMKGAAGQAVQAFNIMYGLPETRIKERGRIGVEKVFNFVKRFDRGDFRLALERGLEVIQRRTRYVRALNMIVADTAQHVHVTTNFREDPEYFQMHCAELADTRVICSDGALVRGMRNKGIRVRENGKTLIKRDFSGKPIAVNRNLLGVHMSSRETEQRYGLEVYPKRDITVVKGKGAEVWDDRGRRYIDCVAGIGVASVGHANPAVAEALAEQARTLVTCPGIFYNDVRARLLEKLASVAPGGLTRGFLCNSGAEAVEAAIKFARLTTGRTGIVSAMRGFHGRTLGALSATFKKEYRDVFKPLVPGFSFVPFNNPDKLRDSVGADTAAVIVEPVQGEGGIRPASAAFLRAAREVCDETGALLVFDEIQTGFCRTGRMFACERYDVVPDMLCLAQGDRRWGAAGGRAGRRPDPAPARQTRDNLRRQSARLRGRPGHHRLHAGGAAP